MYYICLPAPCIHQKSHQLLSYWLPLSYSTFNLVSLSFLSSYLAELQRGESFVEKQVKEARTKCRSIASLLTDAPNPNSKGVLMFKKRRQRAKKYTLTCFGKAEGDKGEETEGETEEEGGSSILSSSEVDEEGFSASFDPTWDTGYLDLLDRRSSACPSTTPTTPTTPTINQSSGLDFSACHTVGRVTPVNQSLGLDHSSYQDSRLESSITKEPVSNHLAQMSPPAVALTNGRSVAVSRASVVLSQPSQTPSQNVQHGNPGPNPNLSPSTITESDHHLHNSFSPNTGVLNRTARPFTPVSAPSRSTVTSVMFRPPQPKPLTAAKPVAAVSMVTSEPTYHPSGPDARRAVSSTSLYIPPRNNNSNTLLSVNSPATAPAPSSSLSSAPLSQSPSNPQIFSSQPTMHASPSTLFSPIPAHGPPFCPSSAQPFSAPGPQLLSSPPTTYPPPCSLISPSPMSPPCPPNMTPVSLHAQPTPHASTSTQLSPPLSNQLYSNMTGAVTPGIDVVMATASSPEVPAADSLVTREQRISVPAARTGILQNAHRRSIKKPMFCSVQNKDISPNPDLLSMVQNMDDHFEKTSASEPGVAPTMEAGHESGPEEDWLRLGAEACNFMQAQRGTRPPPVAPKPQASQGPQLAGKGGQLFARRQNRMDRYIVDRSPSVAATPYSAAQARGSSPTPSLPATWKYSSNIRAPPPISYNPLLSPSCPPKAQKKSEVTKPSPAGPKGQKVDTKPVDVMNHKPYQLNSTLFNYGGRVLQDTPASHQQQGIMGAPHKTARVKEVKRFSTPPPISTGPALKVIVPRSATTLGERLWNSDVTFPPPTVDPAPYQSYQPQPQPNDCQWVTSHLSPALHPAPTAPLPQLPTFASAPIAVQSPTFSHLQSTNPTQDNRQFKSSPDLSPLDPAGHSLSSSSTQPSRVPRPRFSTSNLGLQPCVWRPGSTMH